MKPEFFAVIAVVIYAAMAILIDQYLASYAPPAILLLCYVVMAPLAAGSLGFMKYSGVETNIPKGLIVFLVFAIGLMYFVADFSYVKALSGGRVVSVTLILILIPVLTSFLKYFFDKEIPSSDQLIAFVLAVSAVYFSSRG